MRSITLHTSPHTHTHTCTRNDATVKFPQMNSRWNLSILTSRVRLTCKVQCWMSINVTRGPRAKYLLPNANDEHRLIYQHRQEASAHQHIVHATATFDRQQGETAAFGEWNEFSGSQKLLHCIRFQHYKGIWWLSTLTLSLSLFPLFFVGVSLSAAGCSDHTALSCHDIATGFRVSTSIIC